jgi:hypothetical protein
MNNKTDLRTFLSAVLPIEDGAEYYLASGQAQRKGINHAFNGGFEQLVAAAETLSTQQINLFFSTASIKPNAGNQRTTEHVSMKKCFYVDVDWQTATKKNKDYASQSEAMVAVVAFIKDIGIPPSYVVMTGGGVHVYWALDEAIELEAWRPIAMALKHRVKDFGLKADLGVTADPARILRIPTSTNHKEATPRPCSIKGGGSTTAVATFREKLQIGTVVAFAIPDKFKENFDEAMAIDATPKYFAEIIKDCASAKRNLDEHGEGLDNEQWVQSLRVLTKCVDGELFVHEVSNLGVGYSHAETQETFERLSADEGVTSCAMYEGMYPDTCKACPHYQAGRSPIHFGNESTKIVNVATGHTDTLPPNYIHKNRGTYLMVEEEDEDGNMQKGLKHAFDAQISQMVSVHAKTQSGDSVRGVRFVVTQNPHRSPIAGVYTANIDSGMLADDRSFQTAISNDGVALMQKEFKEMRTMVMSWRKQLQARAAEVTVPNKLGWVDGGHRQGFLLGEDLYWDDGSRNAVFIDNKPIVEATKSKGSIEEWRTQVKACISIDHIETNVCIAAAFGSPLVKFFSESCGILSLASASSGSGKTAALTAGASVWGNPKGIMGSQEDTLNYRVGKLGMMNNIPGCWDELRVNMNKSDDRQAFNNMVYSAANGSGKGRMNANATLKEVSTWETLIITTSNGGLMDSMARQEGDSTNAGVKRMLEIEVQPLPDKVDPIFSRKVLEDHQYGTAGRVYVKWLLDNYEVVKKVCATVEASLTDTMDKPSENRFIRTVASAVIAGAALAKMSGVIDLDSKAVSTYIRGQVSSYIDCINDPVAIGMSSEDSVISTVGDYINQHKKAFVVMEKIPTAKNNLTDTNIKRVAITGVNSGVMGSIATIDKVLRIPKAQLDSYFDGRDKAASLAKLQTLGNRAKSQGIALRKLPFGCGTSLEHTTEGRRIFVYEIAKTPMTADLFG